ncbi:hypothetical protein AYI68_g1699 [Smittium mucronatum]|uniref:Uncharacterized protein n=1 Tax=Smittium mucronatum TaxID=133383 RepID=A0A1R0H511_9FUNG|nr:hypothetical protein AYI68_g1699 [Smittium mucronatum]
MSSERSEAAPTSNFDVYEDVKLSDEERITRVIYLRGVDARNLCILMALIFFNHCFQKSASLGPIQLKTLESAGATDYVISALYTLSFGMKFFYKNKHSIFSSKI